MCIVKDYFTPQASPFGIQPSRFEQWQQRRLDATAEYKIEAQGIVDVKNYRWTNELVLLLKSGSNHSISMVHFVKYRKDRDNPDWFAYQECVSEKEPDNDYMWDYIGSVEHKLHDSEYEERLRELIEKGLV
jgi:hypothetical protein